VQWPWKADAGAPVDDQESKEELRKPQQQRRLFEDGKFFTADERARFVFEAPRPVTEPVDAKFPLVLLTGRGTSAQWHTQTRTAKSAILRKLYPAEVYVELHPLDAKARHVKDGEIVQIGSRRATIEARARITSTVQRGQVFMPMHYPEVNQLTLNVVDPQSRQPSYKHCAVQIERRPALSKQRLKKRG
jgi:assimilatory nitrate reductase catalytic subunit